MFAGAEAASGAACADAELVAGAEPNIATSGAPELSLLLATIRAAAPAMLNVMKAIKPLLADEPADERRLSFCGSAESRRIGLSPVPGVPLSAADRRLGRVGGRPVSAPCEVGSMPDNVSSLWPLGPVSPLEELGLVFANNSKMVRPPNGFDARYDRRSWDRFVWRKGQGGC